MIVALDTNVLAYAEGVGDARRQGIALDVVNRMRQGSILLPVQTLGELFTVLVRKGGRSRSEARDAVLAWKDAFDVAPTTCDALVAASDLCVDHALGVWDAIILAVAADGGCRLLLSEDLQDGFTWRGVTVVNPFASESHDLLRTALGE